MWNPFRIFFEHDYRWNELDKSLTHAFEKIKAERKLVYSWLHYHKKKDRVNEKRHQKILEKLEKHDTEILALKHQIIELKNSIKSAKISPIPDQVRTETGLVSEPVSGLKSQSGLVKRIASMIRPQRKEYVMQKILDLTEKGNYTTKQIETVIVREKGLCGRTAFYDYLKELKYKKLVEISSNNGRKVLKTVQI